MMQSKEYIGRYFDVDTWKGYKNKVLQGHTQIKNSEFTWFCDISKYTSLKIYITCKRE